MLLDGLNRLIDRQAKSAGITDEWDVQEAKDIFLPIFNWSGRDSWFHAHLDEAKSGRDRVLTNEVAEAARGYMQRDWLRDEALDWLLADAIAFGEVNSTFKTMSPTRFYYRDGEPVVWLMGLAILGRLLMWAVWLVALFMIYTDSQIMAAVMVATTIGYQYAKRKRLQKINTLLDSLLTTYDALDACPPSWRNVYALMEKSRDVGAKWPTQLYRLIERNLLT